MVYYPEPGVGLKLYKTEYVKEDILTDFCHTKTITTKVDKFFSKLHIYKKYGVEVPKRGMLLYGPAGTGKTASIKIVSETYAKDGKTAVILWATDKISASDVKEYIKHFSYNGVEKLILVAEDLGGVEVDEVKVESRSSLLALLDNQEKTFTIPTLILSTTNHPEIFNSNLVNRPKRFDDKIEVGYPKSDARKQLFKFYLKENVTDQLLDLIATTKFNQFSAAHIQEIMIRSELYDMTIEDSMNDIAADVKKFEKMFQEKRKLGLDSEYYE